MEAGLTPQSAEQAVLWGGLAIGLVLGVAAQASRFCTRGAIADWYAFRGPARMLTWLLAVAVAALGSQALISFGAFDATQSISWSPRLLWLAYPVAGWIFGWGMILAAGCPQRSLVKAGSGDLKAVVTLVAAAIGAQMTLRGVLALPRTQWLERFSVMLDRPQDLGSLFAPWFGISADVLRWVLLLALLALVATLLRRWRHSMDATHWAGGLAVGVLVPVAFALTGHLGFIAEHPETLETAWMGTQSHRPEALSFASPLAHTLDLLSLWTDASTRLSFGIVLVIGVLAGSLVSAFARREFRLESFRSPREMAAHLVGGLMMGFGGVTAMGCSIGQGVTGVAMLSTGAVLATAGIVAGAWFALSWQTRRMGLADGLVAA